MSPLSPALFLSERLVRFARLELHLPLGGLVLYRFSLRIVFEARAIDCYRNWCLFEIKASYLGSLITSVGRSFAGPREVFCRLVFKVDGHSRPSSSTHHIFVRNFTSQRVLGDTFGVGTGGVHRRRLSWTLHQGAAAGILILRHQDAHHGGGHGLERQS